MTGVANASHRTETYFHKLALATSSRDLISDSGKSPDAVFSGLSGVAGDRDADCSGYDGPAHSVTMRLGSVPYVSHRPGAYSRLILAVHVRWQTGLEPVVHGDLRAATPIRMEGLADVS